MTILQIGLGGFGKNHLRAWCQLGRARQLRVTDLDPAKLEEAREVFGLTSEQLGTDYRSFLDRADVVDIVTPSDSHAALCRAALEAGKDVFIEKPMTMTSHEADEIAAAAAASGRLLQVGYYYRFHPISRYIREQIRLGQLGRLRYLTGQFMGFKRARTDVGVTQTDGIHFIDLFNALLDDYPIEVYAVTRDHFGRGLEDFSIVLLQYRSGIVAKVESGYIQPGNWVDRVVPNAMTTKDITVVGEERTVRADFEIDKVEVFEVRHQSQRGIWTPVFGTSTSPRLRSVSPAELVAIELDAFLECVASRTQPEPDVTACGTRLARIMDAVYASAQSGQPAAVEPVGEPAVCGNK